MAKIELEVGEALNRIGRLMDAMADPSPAMRMIAEEIRGEVDLAFRESRTPSGEAWTPLLQETVAKRRGTTAQPLRDTGRLATSVMTAHGLDHATVGTNVDYAGFHQHGTRHIPARPFMPEPEELAGDQSHLVLNALQDHIDRALG